MYLNVHNKTTCIQPTCPRPVVAGGLADWLGWPCGSGISENNSKLKHRDHRTIPSSPCPSNTLSRISIKPLQELKCAASAVMDASRASGNITAHDRQAREREGPREKANHGRGGGNGTETGIEGERGCEGE